MHSAVKLFLTPAAAATIRLTPLFFYVNHVYVFTGLSDDKEEKEENWSEWLLYLARLVPTTSTGRRSRHTGDHH